MMQSRQNMASNGLLVWFIVIYLSIGVPWTIACSGKKAQSPRNICTTDTCHRLAEQILSYMEMEDVDPCDNFYKFTCSKFLREVPVSYNQPKVSASTVLENQIVDQLRKILEEESPPNELKAFKLAKNFYKACSNKTHVAEKGLKPLMNFVKSLGGWPVVEGDKWVENDFNWAETVYKMIDAGFPENFFMERTIVPEPQNNNKQLLTVFPPSHLFTNDSVFHSSYYKFAIHTAVSLGVDRQRATEELEAAFRFEENLVKISSSIYSQSVHRFPIRNLTILFPKIPWTQYYRRTLKMPKGVVVDENEEITVKNPVYFYKFQKLISSVSKKIQANYVMYRIVTDFFSNHNDCLQFISSSMFTSVGKLYFRKYIKEDTKVEINEMMENIMKQFRILIQNADWMDYETKKHALDKLDSMGSVIEFDDRLWDDAKIEEVYKDLELDAEDYFHSYLNLTRFSLSSANSINLNPGLDSLSIDSRFVNAYYQAIRNRMVLGAGILQGNFFNSIRPKYMNYGAIGSVIGHEITHGFDSVGRKYDKTGKKVNWWADAETVKKFTTKSQCLVNQYGNYIVEEVGRNLNATRTLNENIADNGGIKTAYLAYKEWVGRNGPEPILPGLPYNSNQMFWISVGHHWCAKYRKGQLFEDLMSMKITHAPEEFRVNGALSNMAEFANDFNCPMGSKMNPETKCSVW